MDIGSDRFCACFSLLGQLSTFRGFDFLDGDEVEPDRREETFGPYHSRRPS